MEGMSVADAMALRNNDGMFGGNGFMGIFGLLILLGIMNGGFGGWGGNNQQYAQYATREQVQAGFDAMNSAEMVIHDFMSDAISDAWMRAKSMQSRYKGV